MKTTKAYLAGLGTAAILIGSTVLVLVLGSGFAAFSGLPTGGAAETLDRVVVDQEALAADEPEDRAPVRPTAGPQGVRRGPAATGGGGADGGGADGGSGAAPRTAPGRAAPSDRESGSATADPAPDGGRAPNGGAVAGPPSGGHAPDGGAVAGPPPADTASGPPDTVDDVVGRGTEAATKVTPPIPVPKPVPNAAPPRG